MANQLCFRCFKMKGDYEVCPHCGYMEGTKARQVYQLSPGTVLHDRYLIGTSIGFGGFGVTYKAYDTVLSVVVAIKEFYPTGLVNRGEGEVKVGIFSGEKETEFKRQLGRFLEEARNMALFSKEKDIVNVYDYFEENQTAYIIMEYVDAPLLKHRLKEQGRMQAEEAKRYMIAILNALSKIHYHGIIHKDISPDNIFLTGEDAVKIFDLGAAKFQGMQSGRTEAPVVKAGYAPPEQYRSKNEQGVFMDIYAAGAVFYEMLTGEKPMEAPDRSVCDTLKKPSAFGIAIDERTERVILKALALKSELRFQTAEQLKEALISQKKVELPEEEIKKRQLKKNLLVFGLAAVIVLVGGIVLLSQTVFSGRGKIDVAKIQADTLEIWMCAKEEEDGEALCQTLQSSVQKECPQLEVKACVFGREEYEKKLQEALDTQTLPDVFCTDGLEASAYCEELSGLLHTMKLSSYLYLNELEREEAVYELPTAMQIGVAYVNREKVRELPEAIDADAPLGGEGAFGYADDDGVFMQFQNMQEPIAWIAGDLSCMDQVKAVTVEQMPPTDFTVVPLLVDGELTGSARNCYGVKKGISDNKKEAGMFLLSLLLGDGMQSVAYMGNEEGIPLNKSVFASYRENKLTTYLAFLKEYDLAHIRMADGDGMCSILKENITGDGQ